MGGIPTAEMPLAQLYRKRAIDRENQRYHRQKNKNRLADLEAQVKTANEKLATAEELIAQLIKERDAPREAPEATDTSSFPPRPSWGIADLTPQELTPDSHHPSSPTPEPEPEVPAEDDQALSSWSVQGLLPPSSAPALHDPIVFPYDLAHDLAHETQVPDIHPTDSEEFAPAREEANRMRARSSVWTHLPKHCSALSPLGRITLSLIAQRPADLTTSELSNSHFPSVNSLLNPSFADHDRPIASTIARHLASVVRVATLPEKLALLYMNALLVRWQIIPTEANYLAIPEFLRPTLLQIVVPHPPDIDNMVWPEGRNRMITQMDHTDCPRYARLSTAAISINWPHGLNSMIEGDSDRDYVMRPAFIEHIRNLDNWNTGQAVVDAYPFLKGAVKVGPPADGP
ncbi:hypothetical protein F5X68DRAFT_279744 [Plectosphaerella plurivora]|uniref:BZIP domain-containing protein n=1 Tax=Plectosphaerella plurivora TaxID=936078 RepID=A0A9P9A6P8_9PEZI|nr:hypothetical protein F5X68DRAFT_279744 [Plectosphaerella plurivora]